VDDNVLALIPLLSIVAIFMFLNWRQSNQKNSDTPSIPARNTWLSTGVAMVTLAVTLPIATIATINLSKPSLFSQIQFLSPDKQVSLDRVVDPNVLQALASLPAEVRSRPVAYEGFYGRLPVFMDTNTGEPLMGANRLWIPAPLGALEEPIRASDRKKIVDRFFLSTPTGGLFIWDKVNSFGDRADEWKSLVENSHNCKNLFSSDLVEILDCYPKS
jgi:hypothetical protein